MKTEQDKVVYEVFSKMEFNNLVTLLLKAKYAIKEYLPSIQTAVFRTLNGDLRISTFSLDTEETHKTTYSGQHVYIQLEGVNVNETITDGTIATLRLKYKTGEPYSINSQRLDLGDLVSTLTQQKPPLDLNRYIQNSLLTSLFELANYHNYSDIEIKDENGTAVITLVTPFNREVRTFTILEPNSETGTPTDVVYIGNKATLKTAYEVMSWVLSQEAQGRKPTTKGGN